MDGFSTRLAAWADRNRPDGPRWDDWWAEATQDPALRQAAEERASLLNGRVSAEWTPPVDWHLQALRDQGYAETGVGWRRALSTAVIATGHRRSPAEA